MLVPFSSTRRLELKDALEPIWYSYKLGGVGQYKRSWGHVEGFMFDRELSEGAVVVFYQDLVTQGDVDTGRIDHVWIKWFHQASRAAEVADLMVNDCGQGVSPVVFELLRRS